MAGRLDRLNGWLGRLLFRAIGILCAIVALMCVYTVAWHLTHWSPQYSLWPTIMFSLLAIAAASCVPYCFSRNRTFDEALDAMEGGAGNPNKWDRRR
jgi:hypothetical protein